MELRTLQYFLSVARHLNFTKAAGECYISQAAISQQIDKLERELEVKLFVRNNRSVELTVPGRAFAESARDILERYDAGVSHVRKLAAGRAGRVRVGLLCQYEYQIFSEVLTAYRAAYPEVEVDFGYIDCREMESLLRCREIDLALASKLECPTAPDLLVEKVLTDPICAVMGRSHPLAGRGPLTAEQLREEDIVMFEEANAPHLHEEMLRGCRGFGFEPRITATANTFDTMALMAEAGLGITLLPSRIRDRLGPKLCTVELAGSEMVHDLAVARLAEPGNPALERFYQVLVHYHGFDGGGKPWQGPHPVL